jgi:hypothetical protein
MRRVIIGWVLLVAIVLAVGAAVWIARLAEIAPVSRVPATVALQPPRTDVPNLANPANDRLANLTSTEQAVELGKMIGRGCTGIIAYPMGISRRAGNRGDAYWSVRCTDGKNYLVLLHPDKAGTVSVLGCDVLRDGGIECFKRLPPE